MERPAPLSRSLEAPSFRGGSKVIAIAGGILLAVIVVKSLRALDRGSGDPYRSVPHRTRDGLIRPTISLAFSVAPGRMGSALRIAPSDALGVAFASSLRGGPERARSRRCRPMTLCPRLSTQNQRLAPGRCSRSTNVDLTVRVDGGGGRPIPRSGPCPKSTSSVREGPHSEFWERALA